MRTGVHAALDPVGGVARPHRRRLPDDHHPVAFRVGLRRRRRGRLAAAQARLGLRLAGQAQHGEVAGRRRLGVVRLPGRGRGEVSVDPGEVGLQPQAQVGQLGREALLGAEQVVGRAEVAGRPGLLDLLPPPRVRCADGPGAAQQRVGEVVAAREAEPRGPAPDVRLRQPGRQRFGALVRDVGQLVDQLTAQRVGEGARGDQPGHLGEHGLLRREGPAAGGPVERGAHPSHVGVRRRRREPVRREVVGQVGTAERPQREPGLRPARRHRRHGERNRVPHRDARRGERLVDLAADEAGPRPRGVLLQLDGAQRGHAAHGVADLPGERAVVRADLVAMPRPARRLAHRGGELGETGPQRRRHARVHARERAALQVGVDAADGPLDDGVVPHVQGKLEEAEQVAVDVPALPDRDEDLGREAPGVELPFGQRGPALSIRTGRARGAGGGAPPRASPRGSRTSG